MGRLGTVAAGIVDTVCTLGESRYGIPRSELCYVSALEARDLRDPAQHVPAESLLEAVSYLLERTQDRSLGIRFAEITDLRTQGFWGYLFMSCLSVRQGAELLMRFQRVRHSSHMSFRTEGQWAVFEREPDLYAPLHLQAIVGDAFLASFCFHRRRWLASSKAPAGAMQAWLTYPEEPHHQELRALVGGPITFEAPFLRHQIPASELDLTMQSADPHLLHLAELQLEEQLQRALAPVQLPDLVERVRSRLAARLHQGEASFGRIARDLHFSTRTLRRRLETLGLSFQRLLDEVRYKKAIEYLTKTEDAIESVSQRLGYGDPSNFRRAFRRWAGVPPAAYRAQHARDVESAPRKVSERA